VFYGCVQRRLVTPVRHASDLEYVRFLQEISTQQPTQARIDEVLGHLVVKPEEVSQGAGPQGEVCEAWRVEAVCAC
jgi:hypothetical protein